MEDNPVQAYERRMRKFNFVVIVASLIAFGDIDHPLVAVFTIRPSGHFEERPPID